MGRQMRSGVALNPSPGHDPPAATPQHFQVPVLSINKRASLSFITLAASLLFPACGGSVEDGLFSTAGNNTGGGSTAGSHTGGGSNAGSNTGGSNTGGSNTGGSNTGGSNTGGSNTGGSNTGGSNTGGSNTGGSNTGGSNVNSWTHCDDVSECTLITKNCCGVCGTPRFSDLMPIRWDKAEEYRDQNCDPHEPCPSCPSSPNTMYPAMCRGGDCVAVDPLADDASIRCDRDEDCVVRWGGLCCEPCQAWNADPIAVNRQYQQAVCGNNYACPECEVPPPPSPAFCVEGSCWLALVGGDSAPPPPKPATP